MRMSDASRDNTAAERQRRKRQRDAAAGWASVRVRVPVEKVVELKDFVVSLGEPATPTSPGEQLLPLEFKK